MTDWNIALKKTIRLSLVLDSFFSPSVIRKEVFVAKTKSFFFIVTNKAFSNFGWVSIFNRHETILS